MTENIIKYDLILQNRGSKQEYVIKGLQNASKNPLYYDFPDFKMPEGATEGEYLYIVLIDVRNDVEYVLKDDLFASIARTSEGDIEIRNLDYDSGIMKYGTKNDTKNKYRTQNKDFIYRAK